MTGGQWAYVIGVGAYAVFAVVCFALMWKYRNDPSRM
jgi:hypothetical protein